MVQMKHRVLRLFAAFSLLLLVGTVTMWVRGHWRYDIVEYRQDGGRWLAQFGNGYLRIGQGPGLTTGADGFQYDSCENYIPPATVSLSPSGITISGTSVLTLTAIPKRHFGFLGIYYNESASGGPYTKILSIPFWLILLMSAAMPIAWHIVQRRKRCAARRRNLGLCPACGYDLRASPNRCPECGTAATAKATSSS
jgi:hypothetical protein